MCGFAGFYDLASAEDQVARCRAMLDSIIHRGPDAEGIWTDSQCGLTLGFRRLAILDLTPAGDQPMASHSGRLVVVFNGEIYNTNDLRRQLEAERDGALAWRGHSDTETLLECIESWGVAKALRAFKGMFAMALYDRQERTLTLARDRFGEKPLYYGWNGSAFLFGSELKALRKFPGFQGRILPDAVASYLTRGYVPSPLSIYEGIGKLSPGCWLTLPVRPHRTDPEMQSYWSVLDVAQEGRACSEKWAGESAVDALETVLSGAVRRQMLSDVPLGALLSGGIDSSLIVALMARVSSRPVQTFTIGVDGWGLNEAPYAREVARLLGTDHEELQLTGADALAIMPDMPGYYDEPFSDTSQIPTFLVCRMARRKVTVALSGDGGDELFGGYNRYFLGVDLWDKSRRLPSWLRSGLGGVGGVMGSRGAEALFDGIMKVVPRRFATPQAAEKIHKGLRALAAKNLAEVSAILLEKRNPALPPAAMAGARSYPWPALPDPVCPFSPVEKFMLLDALTYLPDDILVKVDRAAMASSLETRAPFLDPDVCAFAWSLPLAQKVGDREGKIVVKELLNRYLPESVFKRPKSGFGVPVAAWLRGPLRGWAEDILFDRGSALGDCIDLEAYRSLWEDFQKGSNRSWEPLWVALMLGGWLEGQSVQVLA